MRDLFTALGLVFLVAAVPAAARAGENPEAVVTIKKMKFQPAEITVRRGATVRWENREKRQYHNVWFEQAGDEEPDYIFPGEFYERTFHKAGDYPYHCGPHPEMTGIVHVVE